MEKELDWQRLAAKLFCIIVVIFAAVVLPVVAIKILLPFILSALFCALIIPAARRMSELTHINEKACRIILLVASFTALSAVISPSSCMRRFPRQAVSSRFADFSRHTTRTRMFCI